jgi:gamma-tubulin complex component 3
MEQVLEEVSFQPLSRAPELIVQVSKPFFATLQRWIFSGDLHDPFQEFFVQLNSDTRDGRISPYYSGAGAGGDMGFEGGLSTGGGVDEAHAVWEKKYVFVKKMVPGFVSEEFGKKVCCPSIRELRGWG